MGIAMVELAQELTEAIVEYVSMSNINGQYSRCSGTWWDHTDHANLKACALVCRTFLVPSQRCLFRLLKLEGRGTGLDGIPQSPTWPLDLLVDVGKWTPSAAQTFIPLFSAWC
jgi:hypothetical protein